MNASASELLPAQKVITRYTVLDKPKVFIEIVEGIDGRRRYIIRVCSRQW